MALLQPPSTTILQNEKKEKKQNKKLNSNRECKTIHHHPIKSSRQSSILKWMFDIQVNDFTWNRTQPATNKTKMEIKKHFYHSFGKTFDMQSYQFTNLQWFDYVFFCSFLLCFINNNKLFGITQLICNRYPSFILIERDTKFDGSFSFGIWHFI